jgi:hypothetical protein
MADNGWQRIFEDPIPLRDGRKLVTLRDAANYITSLPKKESDLPEWQAAIEVLMLLARSAPSSWGCVKSDSPFPEQIANETRFPLWATQLLKCYRDRWLLQKGAQPMTLVVMQPSR